MPVERLVVLGVVAVAAVLDVRSRRIPNFLTFGSALAALVYHLWAAGFHGLLFSLSGWCVGVGLLLPLFLLGGMGAGDVKLLGAVGSWLGPLGVLWAGLYAVLAGGILALVVATINGYTSTALRNIWALLGFWRATGIQPLPGLTMTDAPGPRLAYGLAIALGTLMSVWLK